MSGINFSTLPPLTILKDHVRRILITKAKHVEDTLQIAPTGFSYFTYSRYPIELHYSDRVRRSDEQLYFAGQLNKELPFFKIDGSFFHVGLELYPTALYYFFEIQGLVDDGYLVKEKFPAIADKFRQEFSKEKDAQKIALGLQKVLIDRLENINILPSLEQSLSMIYEQHGTVELSDLVNKSGMSSRHFRRVFKNIIGISPKKYCKIIQFNAVFEAIQSENEEGLYQLALQNGYYDHAHFIHDFKRYIGQSPQKFLQSGEEFLKQYLGSSR